MDDIFSGSKISGDFGFGADAAANAALKAAADAAVVKSSADRAQLVVPAPAKPSSQAAQDFDAALAVFKGLVEPSVQHGTPYKGADPALQGYVWWKYEPKPLGSWPKVPGHWAAPPTANQKYTFDLLVRADGQRLHDAPKGLAIYTAGGGIGATLGWFAGRAAVGAIGGPIGALAGGALFIWRLPTIAKYVVGPFVGFSK